MILLPAVITFAIGACRVTDGDSIRCGEERIRLARIDAPELNGPNWALAMNAKIYLDKLIDGNRIVCVFEKRDKYQRLLGECMAGDTRSLSDEMVREGYAKPYFGGKRKKW